MTRRRSPPEAPRPSWHARADAVGHCILVFAFVPALAALPAWLAFEAGNRLNLEDAVVLVFLPVRGLIAVVSTFLDGVVPGVLAGAIDGVVVAAWCARRGAPATWRSRIALGVLGGALASALMTLAVVALRAAQGGVVALPAAVVAFELASGAVCGVLAAPRAVRLATAEPSLEAAPAAPSPRR